MVLERLVEAGRRGISRLCWDGFVGCWRVLSGGWVVVDALSFEMGSKGAGLAELDGWYMVMGYGGP